MIVKMPRAKEASDKKSKWCGHVLRLTAEIVEAISTQGTAGTSRKNAAMIGSRLTCQLATNHHARRFNSAQPKKNRPTATQA